MIKWALILSLLYVLYQGAERFFIHPQNYRYGFKAAALKPAPPFETVTPKQPIQKFQSNNLPSATPAPLWQTVSEPFRGGDGVTFLRTKVGSYELGVMSPLGYVEGIRGKVAKLRDPSGHLLYVVAVDIEGQGSAVATAITESPKTIGAASLADSIASKAAPLRPQPPVALATKPPPSFRTKGRERLRGIPLASELPLAAGAVVSSEGNVIYGTRLNSNIGN